jgi:hypothetical protein
MKKTNSYLLLMLSILVIGIQACKKTVSEVPTVDYTVTVSYPDSYAQSKAANAKVTLTNSTTNNKLSMNTNADGVATFAQLLPGNYQVSVERTLNASEAATLTGIETEAFLNASATNQLITVNGNLDLKLSGSAVGGLVFKQIYYSGSRTPANGIYLTDQFYEIYNNSTEVMYADSLYLGESGGSAKTSSTTAVFGFDKSAGNVYLVNVWMIPGSGKSYPIQPGKSIIISSNAINHKSDPAGNANSVDLGAGISDFEGYVASTNRDTDNPDVPNMELVQYGLSTFTWNTPVFGPSMVIFKSKNVASYRQLTEPGSTSSRLYMEVPGSVIIDAVEANANATAATHKRFPSALDAGFQYCSGTYVREAIVRKVRTTVNGRRVLQDTNNSTDDFTVTSNILPKGWL